MSTLEANSWRILKSGQCLEMKTGSLVSEYLLVPGGIRPVGRWEDEASCFGAEGPALKSSPEAPL